MQLGLVRVSVCPSRSAAWRPVAVCDGKLRRQSVHRAGSGVAAASRVGTDRGPTTLSWTRETVCDGQCRCQSVRGCSWGAQQSSRRWEEVEMSQSPSSRPGCSRQPGRPQVVLRHSTLDRGFHRELGRPCSHAVARGGSGESERFGDARPGMDMLSSGCTGATDRMASAWACSWQG